MRLVKKVLILFLTVYTKILVAMGNTSQMNGNSEDTSDVIEIIDLTSSTTTCQSFPSFAPQTIGSIGGLGFEGIILKMTFLECLIDYILNLAVEFR